MNKIRNQHKFIIYSVFALSASLYFFILINAPSTKDALSLLQWFGISWVAIAASIIFLYEKWGWKILNPRLDFAGQWCFSEEQFICNPETQQHTFAYVAKGNMTIVQDVSSIAIIEGQTQQKLENSTTTDIATWWSVACDLNDTGSILYCALDHKSTPGRKGGAVRYGVEVFTVKERDSLGHPIKMSSVVYHCIGAGVPHLVNVDYERKPNSAHISWGKNKF
jgi:hypothetical protein